VVDLRLGGLRAGLLAVDSDGKVDDVTELEEHVVPFRILRVNETEMVAPSAEWRDEARIPIQRSDAGVTEWLLVESLITQAAESEEGRSGSKRDQPLDEHQEWAEARASQIAERLGLARGYDELLAFSARRHDEGKQEACWQRAFHARSDKAYAKTTTAPDLKILAGYRHELGSLPYAEADDRFKALPPELRELCLHLIAAHHGYARPLIRTSGAPEPPSRLVSRAQQIALRFAALERRWGPWGLAWWEALLRAADQQASRLNDVSGGERG
jgi:CRISPR-associated endonuclease/helicase Cas3